MKPHPSISCLAVMPELPVVGGRRARAEGHFTTLLGVTLHATLGTPKMLVQSEGVNESWWMRVEQN